MRFAVGVVLFAAFQCGQAPATPGSAGSDAIAPATATGPLDRVLGEQPATICDGWTASREPDLMDAQQLVARHDHACARISSGRVRCWGSNASQQLGLCEEPPHTAVPQTFPGVDQAKDVAVGRYATCVVDDTGGLWCSSHARGWLGAAGPGRINGVTNATAVAVGDLHACVLLSDGQILCFGRSDAEEALGPTAQLEDRNGVEAGAGFIDLQRPTQLVAGASHNCALEGQGRVMCWGQNAMGQLGDPTAGAELDDNRGTPRRVASLPYIESVHAEQNTTCAVTDSGELYCWGEGFGAQALGVRVPPTKRAAMGPGFVCLATRDGSLWCGGEDMAFVPESTTGFLPGYLDTQSVAVGNGFVCARRRDGIVACQGDNAMGQLGGQHADEKQRLQPTKVLLGGVAI